MKNTHKRIQALVLAVMLSAVVLAGCSGAETGYISREEAQQIALGIEQGCTLKSITFKTTGGIAVWSGYIITGEEEMPFVIDAASGIVIGYGESSDVTSRSSSASQSSKSSAPAVASTPAGYIGEDAAVMIALVEHPTAMHLSTAISVAGGVDVYVCTLEENGANVNVYVNARTGEVVDPNASSASSSSAQ